MSGKFTPFTEIFPKVYLNKHSWSFHLDNILVSYHICYHIFQWALYHIFYQIHNCLWAIHNATFKSIHLFSLNACVVFPPVSFPTLLEPLSIDNTHDDPPLSCPLEEWSSYCWIWDEKGSGLAYFCTFLFCLGLILAAWSL